ncbi:MAG: hypothetical protein IKW20_09435 [Bacteroidales bacterium]|nr:hypothetical protein [Bacteroidales bacterium]
MKRVFIILISIFCLGFSFIAAAQNNTQAADDVYLVPNPQTAKWSYIHTDSKGKHVSTSYHSVESLKGDGVNGRVKFCVEDVYTDSNETTKDYVYYRFKNGEYVIDMSAVLGMESLTELVDSALAEQGAEVPEEEIEAVIKEELNITGDVRGIPRYPKVGKLPDYKVQFKFSILNIKIYGENRSIVGIETIQTPAGEFECFILEETLTTKMMLGKEVEKIRAWYAYGIGLVKEITYDKKDKLVSTTVLNEINW